jgi:hypothetical protein
MPTLTVKIITDLLNLLIATDRKERAVYAGMLTMQSYLDGKLEGMQTALDLIRRLDEPAEEEEN